MEPVRWGVLGVANIATGRLIPGMRLVKEAVLYGIASRTLAKAQAAGAELNCKAYDGYDALLADPDIEAVYIPLPNGIHAEWAIKAMRAGKDVLCEKPITMDAAEAREVQAVREETGRVCLEAFAYRFNPVVAKAIEIANSGALGELKQIHASMNFQITPDASNVRLMGGFGGGALYDVGCYSLNCLRMLAGREPQTAYCKMTWSDEFDVDMTGAGTLDFGAELFGTFDFGFLAGGLNALKVIGTGGTLLTPFSWNPPDDTVSLIMIQGGVRNEITVPFANDYAGEVKDMSDHIRGVATARYLDEPLDSTMRVIDACYKSNKTGQAETV